MGLTIAKGLSVPDDFVTARVQLEGMSGAGKSNAFAVMVEAVYDLGAPFTWLDPYGAARGIRSNAAGDGPGLNVPIIGGYHGDLPLHASSGALIARELYHLDASAVLDLSAFTPIEVANFVADYCDELFALHLKRKKVRALFGDEASQLAPQTPSTDAEFRAVVALQRVHTGGRGMGIGLKLATQSLADQAKRTLKQAEMIVALRTFSPLDQKPVFDYLRTSVTKEQADEIKRTLSTLKDGEAWFIAPRWLGTVKKARFPMRRTFDSSSTPKVGEIAREPRVLAPVEIARLRDAIEKGADSPATDALDAADVKALRLKVAQLTTALEAAEARIPAPATIEIVEVPVPIVTPETLAALQALTTALQSALPSALHEALAKFDLIRDAANALAADVARIAALSEQRPIAPPPETRLRDVAPKRPIPAAAVGDTTLRAGARRMLDVLARCGGALTKQQLATLADVNRGSGTFSDYVRKLVQLGYVRDDGSSVHLLPAGASAIGAKIRTSPPTTAEILAWYSPKLRAGARRMLDLLVRNYPHEMRKDTLAAEAGVNRNSGTFSDYVRILARNGLIENEAKGSRTIRASASLFLAQQRI